MGEGTPLYIQMFLRGMHDVTEADVQMIFREGLSCALLRRYPQTSWTSALHALDEDGLHEHVSDFTNAGPSSAYVSLTAGTRSLARKESWFESRSAWNTAVGFATNGRLVGGWILYGWVICLGVPSYHVPGVAEDIRDHHLYPRFNRFWSQGEVCAKLSVPANQILHATETTSAGVPLRTLFNDVGLDPATFSNVRQVIR